MTAMSAEPEYVERLPDIEKSLGTQQPAVDGVPNEAERTKESSPDDATPPKAEEDDEDEKEKAGSMRDYFVSGDNSNMITLTDVQ